MITHDEERKHLDIKLVIELKVRCNKEVRKYLNDYITQNEQRNRDLARYLELQEKYEKAQFTFVKASEMQEYFRLNQKLSKGA